MRCATVFVCLAFGFIACGGSNSASVADVNSSAVSDSATESADIASSFAQESSSTPSYLVTPYATTGDRAELVVALETIAANPSACTSGSASLTPAGNKTAGCANIGNDGSYPGGATLQFNSCALANSGTVSGTATVAVTRALSAGATCGPTASIDVTHQVSFTNLTYVSPSGYVLEYPTYDAVAVSTHAIGAAPTLITLSSLSAERTIHDPAGVLTLDHVLSGSGTTALSAGMRTLNGTFTVIHELLHFTAQAVFTNVERVETCCKPISGAVAVTLTGASSESVSGTFTYGPSCGDVELDGTLLAVAECL